jgi:EAL domain-containing protein (putative c-di-GMP-specific phosphodiesterase class I)
MSRDLFLIHYQPILDISTGSIAGVEALLRLRHPVHGVMSAANLIPVAEETGLIVEIGDWVLRKVCEQVNKWNEMGFRGLRTAVNVSARQLKQRGTVEALIKILEQSLTDPGLVEFELTESVIMEDTDETIAVFHRLKEKGIKLSIDDFGTGYSSLSYLSRLPVDNVKIDGSFVKQLSANTYENALVKAIVEVAHSRNLRVIAEGVENREQLKQLSVNRCDEAQGFLISRPLPEDAMTELLKRFARKKARIAT